MNAEDVPNRCNDCGKPSHPYMVHDWLWEHIGVPEFLCIPCFEKRIGRSLTQQDLAPDTPANAWMRWDRENLLSCDAATAWSILRIAGSRFGWNGLTAERVDEAFGEAVHREQP